jgi:rhodanese-related sulfurtransferase
MRKVITPVLLGLFLVIIVIAGGGCKSTAGVTQTTVSVTEAYNIIQTNKDNANFHIIDIRTPEEYAAGYLENARLINYNAENFTEEISKLDRNNKYLIYCRSARRSTAAMDVFRSLGFTDVSNMEGGITEWQAQGLPVVN